MKKLRINTGFSTGASESREAVSDRPARRSDRISTEDTQKNEGRADRGAGEAELERGSLPAEANLRPRHPTAEDRGPPPTSLPMV